MKNKKLKTILTALMCMILLSVMAVSVFATGGGGSGDVAGAIQGTWDTAKVQIKAVVNNVVLSSYFLRKRGNSDCGERRVVNHH